jgi:hypothetical protein
VKETELHETVIDVVVDEGYLTGLDIYPGIDWIVAPTTLV